MPNRFTAVPARPVPALGPRLGPVVSIADAFMAAAYSRPNGLSLRTSWVTPATLYLAASSALAALVLAVLLVGHGGAPSVIGAVVLVLGAVGSAAVVLVGAAQRRASRP
jgi:hypothetical protein